MDITLSACEGRAMIAGCIKESVALPGGPGQYIPHLHATEGTATPSRQPA